MDLHCIRGGGELLTVGAGGLFPRPPHLKAAITISLYLQAIIFCCNNKDRVDNNAYRSLYSGVGWSLNLQTQRIS